MSEAPPPESDEQVTEAAAAAQRLLGTGAHPLPLAPVFSDKGGPYEPSEREIPLERHDSAEVASLRAQLKQSEAETLIYAEAAQEARLDPLTGLMNRRGVGEVYKGMQDDEAANNRRRHPDHKAHVLVIDLDFFKGINDTEGHGAGDALLKKVAEILRMNVRRDDKVARWGGDEFIILLPNISSERAKDIADAIREETQDLTPITTSVGFGHVDLSRSLEEAVAKADKALYAAKQSGRNVVVNTDQVQV